MNPPSPRTPAEHTTVLLQQAAQSGSPVPIPGAFEIRAGSPTARLIRGAEAPMAPHAHTSIPLDRERLEREREGGGAPSERGGRRATILARLWRIMRDPPWMAVIWPRLLRHTR